MSPSQRWANGKGYAKSPYVHNAIKKYGWENVEKEVVARNLTQAEAENFEKLLIKTFLLTNRGLGYNVDPGGHGRSGYITSEQTKEKIRESMKGRHAGKDNPFYGRKHSPETISKIAQSSTGRRPTEEVRAKLVEYQRAHGSPVRCKETGEKYRSIIEAAEATGIPYEHLKGHLKGDRASTHGTHWEYIGKNKKRGNESQ